MRYFVIAGEASGDLHGAALVRAIKVADPQAEFVYLGGDKMAAEAGCPPLIHYSRMNYMGFSEVLRHLADIRRNMSTTRRALAEALPDRLVLIDYPSFNLKVAAHARRLGIDTTYFISPKIWAWKKWRIRDIRRLVARVCCILPFEPEFYLNNGYDRAYYVGNPSLQEVDEQLASVPSRADFLARNGLRDRPLVALLPGSRLGEIRNNLGVMVEALKHFPQYRGVVAGAPSVPDEFYRSLTDLPVLRDQTIDLLAHSRAALVTSGTATLETALVGTPQVVTYRANAQRVSYEIMKRLLSVRFVSLPNLIAGRAIVPELLVHQCTSEAVEHNLAAILPEKSPARAAQQEGYRYMRQALGTSDAARGAAELIVAGAGRP